MSKCVGSRVFVHCYGTLPVCRACDDFGLHSLQAQWSERLLSRTNMIDGQPFLIPIPQPNPWFWFRRGRHDPYFTIVASVAVPTQMSGRSCNRVLVLVGAPTDCFRDDCVCIPRYAGGEIVAMCMCRGVIQFVTGHLRPCDSCRVRAPPQDAWHLECVCWWVQWSVFIHRVWTCDFGHLECSASLSDDSCH